MLGHWALAAPTIQALAVHLQGMPTTPANAIYLLPSLQVNPCTTLRFLCPSCITLLGTSASNQIPQTSLQSRTTIAITKSSLCQLLSLPCVTLRQAYFG